MHPRALITAVLCASVLGLGLGGCGGGEETTSAESTVATETTRPTTAEPTGEGDPEAAALRERFNEQVLELLTTTQDLSQAQAKCAIDALNARVSDEQIRQAIEDTARTGEPPQALIDEAFDAGAQCSER